MDIKYRDYAIVNDILSGPIFGGMSQPDIGTFESNQQFRCQIHFPSVYKSGIGMISFPNSEDCIINEIEVFIPVFVKSSSVPRSTGTTLLSYLFLCMTFLIFCSMIVHYNRKQQPNARFLYCVSLVLIVVNHYFGMLFVLEVLLVPIVVVDWGFPNGCALDRRIRGEKRFLMSSIIILLTYLIIF